MQVTCMVEIRDHEKVTAAVYHRAFMLFFSLPTSSPSSQQPVLLTSGTAPTVIHNLISKKPLQTRSSWFCFPEQILRIRLDLSISQPWSFLGLAIANGKNINFKGTFIKITDQLSYSNTSDSHLNIRNCFQMGIFFFEFYRCLVRKQDFFFLNCLNCLPKRDIRNVWVRFCNMCMK